MRWVGDIVNGAGDPLELIVAQQVRQPVADVAVLPHPERDGHRAARPPRHDRRAADPDRRDPAARRGAARPNASALAGWRDRPGADAAAGLLGALLAPFHFFYFPAFSLLALAWVAAGAACVDIDAPRNAALLLAPLVLAVPFAVAPCAAGERLGALQLVTGWPSAPREDGLLGGRLLLPHEPGHAVRAGPRRAGRARAAAPRLPGRLDRRPLRRSRTSCSSASSTST